MLNLLAARRFGPLMGALFLGAFNDNLYRTALLFLITYRLMAEMPDQAAQLVAVSAGLFILPYVLFSGLAGQVADAMDKARAARIIKGCEILIMAIGAIAMWLGAVPLMLVVLFAMGLQSTFFGPIKYAILPQHLSEREITGGTALVEAATFVSVLTGQIVGGLIAPEAAMAGILLVALLGWGVSFGIPAAPPEPGTHTVQANIFASSIGVLRHVWRVRHLRFCVLAISWFWSIGAVFTSLFIPLVKDMLNGAEPVATMFLAAFSVGMAIGSLVIGTVLAGMVSARTLTASLILMSLAIFDLYFAVSSYPAPDGALMDIGAFLGRIESWRILGDLTLLAIGGGTYIVPLYTILQMKSEPGLRAQVIAGNNIINSAFMVLFALASGALLGVGWNVIAILALMGAINLTLIPVVRRLRRALTDMEVV